MWIGACYSLMMPCALKNVCQWWWAASVGEAIPEDIFVVAYTVDATNFLMSQNFYLYIHCSTGRTVAMTHAVLDKWNSNNKFESGTAFFTKAINQESNFALVITQLQMITWAPHKGYTLKSCRHQVHRWNERKNVLLSPDWPRINTQCPYFFLFCREGH